MGICHIAHTLSGAAPNIHRVGFTCLVPWACKGSLGEGGLALISPGWAFWGPAYHVAYASLSHPAEQILGCDLYWPGCPVHHSWWVCSFSTRYIHAGGHALSCQCSRQRWKPLLCIIPFKLFFLPFLSEPRCSATSLCSLRPGHAGFPWLQHTQCPSPAASLTPEGFQKSHLAAGCSLTDCAHFLG